MIRPTIQEARSLAGGVLPVAREVFSDFTSSIRVLNNLCARGKDCYLLESVATGDAWGRYSFLGYAPEFILRCRGKKITLETGTHKEAIAGDPLQALKETLGRYKSPEFAWLPPFTGGFVGYFSYDFMAGGEEEFDGFCLMKIDKVIAFDHFRQKIVLICNIDASDPDRLEENYLKGVEALDELEQLALSQLPQGAARPGVCGAFSARFDRQEYCRIAEDLRQHIARGEIFLAHLANRFCAPFDGSLLHTYRILRTASPSPYMAYMRLGGVQIACASPDTLVSAGGGRLRAYPLSSAGGALAEHDILVDAAREDLGKASIPGSVRVERYRQEKRVAGRAYFSSEVSGEGGDALSVLLTMLSGAGVPRRRAAGILRDTGGQGLYGGALGYLSFTGNMAMCMGANLAALYNGRAFVWAGGNILADTKPQAAYEETENKARLILKALNGEEDGL